MSSPLVITPMAFAVHRKGSSPVYGDGSTHVTVVDEGAGPFVLIRQSHSAEVGEIALDADELQALATAGGALLLAHERLA